MTIYSTIGLFTNEGNSLPKNDKLSKLAGLLVRVVVKQLTDSTT